LLPEHFKGNEMMSVRPSRIVRFVPHQVLDKGLIPDTSLRTTQVIHEKTIRRLNIRVRPASR